MTVKIKKGESKKSIESKLSKLAKTKRKGFPAHLFTGKIKIEGDALEIQKKMRKEWD